MFTASCATPSRPQAASCSMPARRCALPCTWEYWAPAMNAWGCSVTRSDARSASRAIGRAMSIAPRFATELKRPGTSSIGSAGTSQASTRRWCSVYTYRPASSSGSIHFCMTPCRWGSRSSSRTRRLRQRKLRDGMHGSARLGSAVDEVGLARQRSRLRTAVAGGVAEYHLWVQLLDDPAVRAAVPLDQDGPPDVLVTFHNGSKVSIECKNASLQRYADGSAKVEVQKTRASKGDPSSRYYSTEQFNVLAVCVWSDRGKPEFRFKASRDLLPHKEFVGRIAPLQRVDSRWSSSVAGALGGN